MCYPGQVHLSYLIHKYVKYLETLDTWGYSPLAHLRVEINFYLADENSTTYDFPDQPIHLKIKSTMSYSEITLR